MIIMVVFIVLLCPACVSDSEKTKSQGDVYKDYTFLIYMNGSDLESEHNAATTDLYEMMKVGTTDTTNVIIETGGTKRWKNHYIDPTQNQRWMVKKNNLEKLQDLGSKNMGVSNTLSDFLIWGTRNYPAKKIVLILWNHGGGSISGFGYDEKHNYDTLHLAELQKALKDAYIKTNTKLEVIGFDACLMASLETAAIVSPYANYLVGSTELEPANGWEYSSFLKQASERTLNGKELGQAIANGFFKDTIKSGVSDVSTLSVIDTEKISDLKTSFEKFITRANKDIYNNQSFNEFSRSVSRSENYGGQSPNEGYSNMIDLGDLARNLSDDYSQDKTKISEDVKEAVVYKVKGNAKSDSSGISVYFPYYNKEVIKYELPIYGNIGFSTIYNQFLQNYTEVAASDINEVALAKDNIDKEGDSYKLNIDTIDTKNVSQIRTVLGKKIDNNKIVLYGGSPTANYNEKKGQVKTKFDHKWISLNGHRIYACITRVQDNYTTYSIPVILNDEYVNIKVVWYRVGGEEGYYKIIGAWHGVIPDNMIVRKEIIKIKRGDKVQPILKEYDLRTKEEKSINGESFILEEEPKVSTNKLEGNGYVLGFCIDDYSLNQCYSEFVFVDHK